MSKVTDEIQKISADGKLDDGYKQFSTGYWGKILPVGGTLLEDVVASVPEPKVPVWTNPENGREEENPNHPDYLQAITDWERERTIVAMEAMLVIGFELRDGVPDPSENQWLSKLQYLERRGILSLQRYNLDDEMDIELIFKRYIACGNLEVLEIGQKAGMTRRDVEAAARTFQGN